LLGIGRRSSASFFDYHHLPAWIKGKNDSGSPNSVFVHNRFIRSPLPPQFHNARPAHLHNASVAIDEVVNEFMGMKFH
jgi:hypothetical protein